MTGQEAKQRRPFHEVIVDAIREASEPEEVALLAKLIKETRIPRGHDEIISVWNRCKNNWRLGFGHGVVESLLEQKQEAEKEEEKRRVKG